jgi:hypothetical protein
MSRSKTNPQVELGEALRSRAEGPSWLVFPAHQQVLASGDLALLERLEKTHRQLESIAMSATAADRERARAAQIACLLTRNLFERILEVRQTLFVR